MIIDLDKVGADNPEGVSCFSQTIHVIPSGFEYMCIFFYNPIIPSGLQTPGTARHIVPMLFREGRCA